MNGVHDMGGMQGFGAINPETNEPLFHAPWEPRVLAMNLATAAWRKWNIDATRFSRERAAPADYLRNSYYERWYDGLCRLMVERGLITPEELASGRPQGPKLTPPVTAAEVAAILDKGSPSARPGSAGGGATARFKPGDKVRARVIHPEGHTRLPRYARGKQGVIAMDHGVHVFADSNASFKGEAPQHLYNVRFEATELWGADAAFKGAVHIDLWDSHLESC